MSRVYHCPACKDYRKTETDGRREFCAVCGERASAARWVRPR